MNDASIPVLRKVGLFLIFTPALVTQFASNSARADGAWNHPLLWFSALTLGLYLSSLRTEQECTDTVETKQRRYSRLAARFGSDRLAFVVKASVVLLLVLFPIALLSLVSNSGAIFWPVVILAAGCVALITLVDNPNQSLFSRSPTRSADDHDSSHP
ncbi:hypothetical protein Caka_2892 [Coraliomargarita akajimensis DSM 45221]|uniref:Uncharacterized protein n=1 Tax=Coraliomargarita akajimensis (strain DSM 45221 / IAM 15411 / JCM 23193 / KCTC 12865 / 04OKA010-24) TaxID=583355 RepID=D5ER61_CORAD|nr:hypothetical protein Caka_2892 [Coraliomargarita akajimensis DSM 45221]